jgi:hypothetical protein
VSHNSQGAQSITDTLSDMLTTHHQETPLIWGDEPASIGLLHDSVGQVRDARGVDDSDQVELDAPGLQTIQRAGAATQHYRHQTDNQLVEQAGPQALLDDGDPHEGHVLSRSSGPRLLDGAFDAVADEGVGRTCRHRVGDAMGQNEQRDAGQRSNDVNPSRSVPRVGRAVQIKG